MSGPANTQFALGVHLLGLLGGHPGRLLSSDAMSESANSNPVHVRRVLGQLRRAGFVDSRSGPHGGWWLTADPDVVTLADVWTAVHGEGALLGLHDTNPHCPVGRRTQVELAAIDRDAAAAVRERLAGTTLAEFSHRVGADTLQPIGT